MAMKIASVLSAKHNAAFQNRPATIAFLGDSVTNGCFELFNTYGENNEVTGFDTVYDPEHSYGADLRRILQMLYPMAQINLVNAGISGDNAPNGLKRMERDLLPFRPDLTVVCFGLNDSGRGDEGLADYRAALVGIVEQLKAAGSEVILMTPQPICARVHPKLENAGLRALGKQFAENFQNGSFARYMDTIRSVAAETNVPLCDCCARWMKLYEGGVDITGLLANYLNHPIREMHWLFASELARTIFEN